MVLEEDRRLKTERRSIFQLQHAMIKTITLRSPVHANNPVIQELTESNTERILNHVSSSTSPLYHPFLPLLLLLLLPSTRGTLPRNIPVSLWPCFSQSLSPAASFFSLAHIHVHTRLSFELPVPARGSSSSISSVFERFSRRARGKMRQVVVRSPGPETREMCLSAASGTPFIRTRADARVYAHTSIGARVCVCPRGRSQAGRDSVVRTPNAYRTKVRHIFLPDDQRASAN